MKSEYEKPFAFVKGEDTVRHASEVRPYERYEWDGEEVHPVSRKWFAYYPRPALERTRPRYVDHRESATHIVAKMLIRDLRRFHCKIGRPHTAFFRLEDVEVERQVSTRRPDLTARVAFCSPYYLLAGRTIHIEVHFANAVRNDETGRLRDLRALGNPVIEFHLPKQYLKYIDIPVTEPQLFRGLIRMFLTSGYNEGTWISDPPPIEAKQITNVLLR